MSVYMTEDEQIEAIKKWWQCYGTLITVVISLLLLMISGYKYWSWHQAKVKTQASTAYEQLMVAFSNQDNKAVKSYARQLTGEYNTTVYAHAARLILAKLYVSQEQYDKARENLAYVAEHAPMKSLQQIAHIRAARLLTAKQSYEKALAELALVDEKNYLPLVNELKGDIFTATGQYQKAIASYKEAMEGVHTQGIGNLYLEMKTSELAALTQSKKNEPEIRRIS